MDGERMEGEGEGSSRKRGGRQLMEGRHRDEVSVGVSVEFSVEIRGEVRVQVEFKSDSTADASAESKANSAARACLLALRQHPLDLQSFLSLARKAQHTPISARTR